MGQNTFLDTGFSDEDATVYALEADCAAAIVKFIQSRYPGMQRAAGKHLGLHQSEVSALLSGNLGRFSLSKLIRVARRAEIRLFLDMGESAKRASAFTLMPTIVHAPVNVGSANTTVDIADGVFEATPRSGSAGTKTAIVRH